MALDFYAEVNGDEEDGAQQDALSKRSRSMSLVKDFHEGGSTSQMRFSDLKALL